MKKKLLYLTSIALFSISAINAQNRTWEIGTTSTDWPANLAQMTTGTQGIQGLTLAAVSATFGGMAPVGVPNFVFSDGYTPANEWKGNGSSSGTAVSPSRRYFSFPVTGPSTIKVWFRVNGTLGRKCQISDGTTLLGEMTDEDSTKPLILTVPYNGTGGTIYVYANSSINYHKIAVFDGILGLDEKSVVTTNVYSNGTQVFVSKVKSSTQVEVYNMAGTLVKSLKTDADTNFDMNTGVYIVKAKSAEGEKSVKVIVK